MARIGACIATGQVELNRSSEELMEGVLWHFMVISVHWQTPAQEPENGPFLELDTNHLNEGLLKNRPAGRDSPSQ